MSVTSEPTEIEVIGPAWLELLPVDDRKRYMDQWLAAPSREREQLAREWQRTAAARKADAQRFLLEMESDEQRQVSDLERHARRGAVDPLHSAQP